MRGGREIDWGLVRSVNSGGHPQGKGTESAKARMWQGFWPCGNQEGPWSLGGWLGDGCVSPGAGLWSPPAPQAFCL